MLAFDFDNSEIMRQVSVFTSLSPLFGTNTRRKAKFTGQMIPDKKVNQTLDKLFKSKPFKSSEFDRNFLTYLVQKTLSNAVPKETTIAIEFFNKDASFDPSNDSIVRTHIHSLRKKLNLYYLTEGKTDKYRIEIPKGSYKIEFSDNPTAPSLSRTSSRSVIFIAASTALLTIAMSALVFFFFLSGTDHKIQPEVYMTGTLWDDMLLPGKPTEIVLGDYFIFVEKGYGESGYHRIRSGSINSYDELLTYYKMYPQYQDRFLDMTQSYLDLSIVEACFEITKRLGALSLPLSQTFASRLTEDDILNLERNMIFIGPLETMRALRRFIRNNRIDWEHQENQVFIGHTDDKTNYEKITIEFDEENRYFRQYGILYKIPGPQDNILFYISVLSPRSISTMVEILINGTFEEQVREEYLEPGASFPTYFEAIVEFNIVNDITIHNVTEFFEISPEKNRVENISEQQ